ncbi:MAG: hypothetical protein KDE31_02435, partial [Caldilineaceae bacterium]|nr:hypothetical protein [Caldilineaceae bacterium]
TENEETPGMDMPASVAPFILRGVTLVGIDSVLFSMSERASVWERLGEDLSGHALKDVAASVPLGDVIARARDLLDGKVGGRLVVRIGAP